MNLRSPRRLSAALCLVIAGLGAFIPTGLAVAASRPTFDVLLGGCIAGGVPNGATSVAVTWRTSTGQLKARFTAPTTNDWTWSAPTAVCRNHVVAAGDTLQAHIANPTSMTRSFTIPNMRGSFARGTWITAGIAPTTGSFLVASWHQYLSRPGFFSRAVVHPARDSDGSWAVDQSTLVGGWTPTGGDRADAVWTSPSSDTVTLRMRAPFITVQVGSPQVTGFTRPFNPVSLVLRASDGTVRGTSDANTAGLGRFSITFRKAGQPVTVRDGDRITGDWAPGAAFVARAIGLTYSIAGNWVDADCQRQSVVGAWGTWGNAKHPFFDGDTQPDNHAPMDVTGSDNHQLALNDRIDVQCGNLNGDRMHGWTVITSSPG